MNRLDQCFWVLIIAAFCLLSMVAKADISNPYTDIDRAARDALIDAYNCGEQRQECGGVIYQQGANYFYTIPVTSKKSFGVVIPQYLTTSPQGMKIVADYHNHLCSIHNKVFANFFSAGDVLVNKNFHSVGYMLSGCDGNIRRYDPAIDEVDDEEVDFQSGKKLFLTCGHISGWINIFTITN